MLSKTKGIYLFELPEAIYVDTCFWNEAYGTSYDKLGRQECVDFLTYCTTNKIRLYVSGIIYDEVQHIIKKSLIDKALNETKINKNEFKYRDGSINSKRLFEEICRAKTSLIDDINLEIQRILNLIDEIAEFLPYECNKEFNDEVIRVYKEFKYEIGVSDVKHAVVCHCYGLNSIATRDGDFWIFDNINIYSPNNEKIKMEIVDRKNVLLPFDDNKY